jgi:Rieske Fe-S protein
LFIATGFSGTGLTYGTAAGKMLSEMICGSNSNRFDAFSPLRCKPLAGAKKFIRENLNAAGHFVADRWDAERVESLDVVKPGEGRLLHIDGQTCAVYRDEQNRIWKMSPVCTHAGCYVRWNNFEKTWDCPCHGGRYTATGQRIYGPPPADLKRYVSVPIQSVDT